MPSVSHPIGILRFVASLVGLVTYACMIALYVCDKAAYLSIIRLVGVSPWDYPFIDSEFMYVMKNSWLHGVNVYQGVPDDVVPGNRMAYSPLWMRLPILSSDKSVTIPVGLITDFLLILSLCILPPARRVRDAILLSLAVTSTMIWFALERNNIDVWIYLCVVLGGLLLRRSYPIRVIAYGLFCLVGLLKYYPLMLIIYGVRERPGRALTIALSSSLVTVIFGWAFWSEIIQQMANVPKFSPGFDGFGAVDVSITLANIMVKSGSVTSLSFGQLELCLRVGLTLMILVGSFLLSRDKNLNLAMASMQEDSKIWLVIGCLLIGGCYLAGQNVGYRGVHLLFVLSGLLALGLVVPYPCVDRTIGRAAIVVVILMWMEGIRGWSSIALNTWIADEQNRYAVQRVVLLSREVLWVYLEIIMLGVLFTFLGQSTFWQWFANRQTASRGTVGNISSRSS